ncbi:unnamed protein product [Brassica oleracea var. botrytis]
MMSVSEEEEPNKAQRAGFVPRVEILHAQASMVFFVSVTVSQETLAVFLLSTSPLHKKESARE